jgi:dTDP-4-dehydrorhamnose 3,5-epimerase
MNIIQTGIEGLLIIEPKVFGDERGYFFESYSERDFTEAVGPVKFVQDNESKSRYGVLRGLHFQKEPYAQAKLVRVVSGAVLDVAVDLRKGSPTFGQHFSVELTGENHRQFFIPKGFAHGFCVLSEEVVFQYKCDEFYHPEAEGGIAWNDPDLAIDWRIPASDLILSPKDQRHPSFKTYKDGLCANPI